MPPQTANTLTLVETNNDTLSKNSGRVSGGQSRNQILIAAAECFKENGFAATSIDGVAHHLGATKGMIYHHYRSKMDLFFAVYKRGMEINFEATQPEASSQHDPLIKLARMAMTHTVNLMVNQAFQRVVMQGVQMHQTGPTTAAQRETLLELIETRDEYETMFRRAIEAAALDEKISLTDPSLATRSLLVVLNSTVYWYTPRKENPLNEQIELAKELVTFALQGLGLPLPEKTIQKWEMTS